MSTATAPTPGDDALRKECEALRALQNPVRADVSREPAEAELQRSDSAYAEAKTSGDLNRWSDNRALNEQNNVATMAGGAL